MRKNYWLFILLCYSFMVSAQKPDHTNEIGFSHFVKLTPYDRYGTEGNSSMPDYDYLKRIGCITNTSFDSSQLDKLLNAYEKFVFAKDSFPVYSDDYYSNIADAYISNILSDGYIQSETGYLCQKKPDRYIRTFNSTSTEKPYSLRDSIGRTDHIYLNHEYNATTLKESIESLAFIESWSFDRVSGTFNKKISGLNLAYKFNAYDDYYEEGETRVRLMNGGFIAPSAFKYKKSDLVNQKKPGVKHKTLLADNVVYEVYIKHQSCDVGYDESNMYCHIEPAQISQLVYDLLQSTKEGKIKVYNLLRNGKIDLSAPLSFNEVLQNLEYTTREIEGLSESVYNKYKKAEVREVWETFHPDEVPEGVTPVIKEILQREEPVYQYDEYGEMKFDDNWDPILEKTEIVYDTVWGIIKNYDTIWRLDWRQTYPARIDSTKEPEYVYTEYGDIMYDEDTWEPVIERYITLYDTIWETSMSSEYVDLANNSKVIIKDIIPHDRIGDIKGLKFYESWFVDPDDFSFYKFVKGMSLIVRTEKINDQNLINRCSIYYPMEEKQDATYRLLYFKFN